MEILASWMRTVAEYRSHLTQSAERINTFLLNVEMECFVFNCFKAIKPLSYKPVIVVSEGDHAIVLGTLVGLKFRRKKTRTRNESDLFNIIREYGAQMKPYVRRAISEEFSALVGFTSKLTPYTDVNFSVDIPPTTICKHDATGQFHFDPIEVDSLLVKTTWPYVVRFFKDGREVNWGDVGDPAFYLMAEDIIEHVVRLYKHAESELPAIIERNNGIMREMERIVAPFIVAKEMRE